VLTSAELKQRLRDRAARRYLAADRFGYYFARGKLGGDPVFMELLARGLLPDGARILDLGCGQGLLGAWLDAASASHRAGDWHDDWSAPPAGWCYRGIERAPADVRRAHVALAGPARVEVGDLCNCVVGAADVAVIFDVLHYMSRADQESLLRRVRAALSPAGLLLLRIGDAGAGMPFRASSWVDRAVLLLRGRGWARLHCRSLREWLNLLAELGFRTESIPMSEHTPFANFLLVARPQ
jgi:SAM-dependent methyltransferase